MSRVASLRLPPTSIGRWTGGGDCRWRVLITPDRWAIVGLVRACEMENGVFFLCRIYVVWPSRDVVTREVQVATREGKYHHYSIHFAFASVEEKMDVLLRDWEAPRHE